MLCHTMEVWRQVSLVQMPSGMAHLYCCTQLPLNASNQVGSIAALLTASRLVSEHKACQHVRCKKPKCCTPAGHADHKQQASANADSNGSCQADIKTSVSPAQAWQIPKGCSNQPWAFRQEHLLSEVLHSWP